LAEDPEAAASAAQQQEGGAAVLSAAGWEHLADVRAPVTLIRGTGGFLTEADRDEFVARVKGARVFELSTGHNVHEELPADLAQLLRGLARDVRDGV
ncbi:alpha/beta fold hydrolase, partial [Microbacterium sp.]